LDDFCKLFHGAPSTGPTVKTYTFEDVVAALNQIVPYDWRGFWTERSPITAPARLSAALKAADGSSSTTQTPSDMMSGLAGMYHVAPPRSRSASY